VYNPHDSDVDNYESSGEYSYKDVSSSEESGDCTTSGQEQTLEEQEENITYESSSSDEVLNLSTDPS